MKGLLLKDIYVVMRQAKMFLVILVLFSVIPGLSAVGLIYGAMLPITALAYDERAKWDTLSSMMPYSKRNIVISKYVLGYIGIAVAGIIAAVANPVVAIFKNTAVSVDDYVELAIIVAIATFVLAVNMPLMFRFGVEKGRIAFLLLNGLAVAVAMIFGDKIMTALSKVNCGMSTIFIITVLAVIVLNAISMLISVACYKRKSV